MRDTQVGGECTRGLKLALYIGNKDREGCIVIISIGLAPCFILGVANCSHPPQLTNGQSLSTYSGGLPGTRYSFQCSPPYYPSEVTNSTCTPLGTWDPAIQCKALVRDGVLEL